MIDRGRFQVTLAAGLVALFGLLIGAVSTPQGVMALAGDPGATGARLYTANVVIDGMGLYGSTVDGVSVTHFDLGEVPRTGVMVIERDVRVTTMAPGAQDWTFRLRMPVTSARSGLDLYTADACVQGIALTRFGLLNGLLDGFVNPAIDNGHHPSLLVRLLNLVGPLGIVDVSVDRMWAEVMVLKAPALSASQGTEVTVLPRSVSPEFAGNCL